MSIVVGEVIAVSGIRISLRISFHAALIEVLALYQADDVNEAALNGDVLPERHASVLYTVIEDRLLAGVFKDA